MKIFTDTSRYIYAALIALITLTGSEKPKPAPKPLTLAEKLCGQWRGQEISVDAGIYIEFLSDGKFELYQKMNGELFELRRGTYTLDGDILSGVYNDQESWAFDYKISISDDVLTMCSLEKTAEDTEADMTEGENTGTENIIETNTYIKTSIPETIKEGATVVVKSGIL